MIMVPDHHFEKEEYMEQFTATGNSLPETEVTNENTADIDLLDTQGILTKINLEDATVASAVSPAIPDIARLVDHIAMHIRRGGRLYYVGAGTSGRLGVLDASECPPTFGCPGDMVNGIIAGGDNALRNAIEGAEDDVEQGRRDISAFSPGADDVVIGITASGGAPYVGGAMDAARAYGSFTALIANTRNPRLADKADVCIVLHTGPEVLSGSTRMKAGTAQKMVLNMITTATMIRLDKVYQNVMVDLRSTNLKLVGRAERIVAAITRADAGLIRDTLRDCQCHPKTAIAAILNGVDVAQARHDLDAAGGSLRKVLAHPSSGCLSPSWQSAPSGYGPIGRYLIGLDSGGTKNTLRIETDGHLLLYEKSFAGFNINASSAESLDAIRSCILSALLSVPLDISQCVSVSIGMAGASRRENRLNVEQSIRSIGFTCPVFITDDATAAFYGAFGEQSGVVLIAGTGSICLGKTQQGIFHRCGGWGHLIGDEGSGFDIGRQVLNAVLKAYDGRAPQTRLVSLLSGQFGLDAPDKIVDYAYLGGKSAISALAPLCEVAASEGDPAASAILETAADSLISYIIAAASHFEYTEVPLKLVLTGGVLREDGLLYQIVCNRVRQIPKCSTDATPANSLNFFEIVKPIGDAAHGAIVYALDEMRRLQYE